MRTTHLYQGRKKFQSSPVSEFFFILPIPVERLLGPPSLIRIDNKYLRILMKCSHYNIEPGALRATQNAQGPT